MVVKQLAAELQIQLAAELCAALADVLCLHGQIFFIVKTQFHPHIPPLFNMVGIIPHLPLRGKQFFQIHPEKGCRNILPNFSESYRCFFLRNAIY